MVVRSLTAFPVQIHFSAYRQFIHSTNGGPPLPQ